MKCKYFLCLLFGLLLILSLFTVGCKKTGDELASPLSPPAWIQGTWSSPGYDQVGSFGWRWVFTKDNAICYSYRQGQLFLTPLDFFQVFMNCQKGAYEYTCKLSDASSDAYYEIHEILEYDVSQYQQDTRYRFTKLTPTTFCYEVSGGVVFTKQ
jgi:hypothetical protein